MRVAFALVVALATSGCFVTRGKGLDDVRAEAGKRGVTTVHWDQGTEADERARKRVRELLVAPVTADSAVEIALLHNRSMQAVYEELGVAQADLVEAGLLENPVLAGSVRFGNRERIYGASIAQEFLSILALPMRKRLARAEWEQAKLRVTQRVLVFAADTRAAWFDAKAAELVAEMYRQVQGASSAGAELARRQHDAGNISDLTLAIEEDLAEQAKLDVADAEAELFATRERLIRMLGVWGADIGFALAKELPALPTTEPPLEHLESVAIRRRLDLAADRRSAEIIARARRTTQLGRFIPGLTFGVEVEKEADGVVHAGPTIELGLPIFNWGQTRVARLDAQLRQAENELVASAVGVRSEVREARDRLLRSRARVDWCRTTLIPLRERIVRLTKLHHDAMLLGPFDLLRAKQDEIDAYRTAIEANHDYWLARIDLERASGGSLDLASEGDALDHHAP